MEVAGKGVLITGGSQGLGAALARVLARRGARLVVTARRQEPLDDLVRSLRAQGADIHALAADVGDKQAVYPLAGAAAALVGPIDLLIHNASTLGPVPLPLLLDTECEDLEGVLAVNLIGPFRLTKAVAGSMVVRRSGLVLQITSDASTGAYPSWGAYGVSKAALDHLGRIWAAELEGTGVRFLTVDPGEMDTQMHADAMPEANRSTLAKPADVALRIAELIRRAESFPSGSRLEIARVDLDRAGAEAAR
jgi:NAD(P)-dependent dehydrogenase (short-subunit alcohol dehydrogenase family)